MCGIAGVIGKNVDENLLNHLLDKITHRGEEKYRYESISSDWGAMGTHRLAIVDESSGQQPFSNKNVFCIFNGEIYNHSLLREELSSYYDFTSKCDTEVILNAYLHWGMDFVEHLDGQFAIAIYDTNKESLVLARDRMGIKGLYYTEMKEGWAFSSELKSLSSISDVKYIKQLDSGKSWKSNNITSYFSLQQFNSSETEISLHNYKSEAKKLLINAVAKRIPDESREVACLLSGGLDSSIITYISSTIRPTVAYTITSPSGDSSDLIAAKDLCSRFNIKHVVISPPVEEMQKFYLEQGVYMTESFEPILVRNATTYHFLCRQLVKDGFKYCLNGEGADELFGGYDFVQEAPKEKRDEIIWNSLSIIDKTYLQMSDRASMYATLETRVPYMDRDFVDLCLSLPPSARLSKGKNKALLRELFLDELSYSITNQRKVGMNEGAGYGVNASSTAIYYQAVKSYYTKFPEKLEEDVGICNEYLSTYQINMVDIEEIYNFAKFFNHNYHRLSNNTLRLQLNGRLIEV